jgi:biotin carboxylase
MQTIVFIGSNKSGTSRDALNTSTEMGYYTVLLTNRKVFMEQRNEFTEVHRMDYVDNLLDEEQIYLILTDLEQQSKQIRAVISFIDPFVSYAAQISKELGLVHLSVEALAKMEEKTRFREQLKNLSASPFHFIFQIKQSIDNCVEKYKEYLPLILKSPISNGSKDVLLAKTTHELRDALIYLIRKYPETSILMEEYLIGPQYLIEVMVNKGQISLVAIIEQEISYDERFIVTGYIYPALLETMDYQKLQHAVASITNQLELTNGTCHLEMKLIKGEWKLIEINPRMSGGAMNRIIQEGTGINLVKETLKLFLGEEPCLEKTLMKHVYAKFLTVSTRGKLIKVTGKNRALSLGGVREVFVKPRKGAILTRPYSLGDRYAYVIASADTQALAKNIAIEAAGEIKFYLEPF